MSLRIATGYRQTATIPHLHVETKSLPLKDYLEMRGTQCFSSTSDLTHTKHSSDTVQKHVQLTATFSTRLLYKDTHTHCCKQFVRWHCFSQSSTYGSSSADSGGRTSFESGEGGSGENYCRCVHLFVFPTNKHRIGCTGQHKRPWSTSSHSAPHYRISGAYKQLPCS